MAGLYPVSRGPTLRVGALGPAAGAPAPGHLYGGSGDGGAVVAGRCGARELVELASEEPLQAADDLRRGLALGGPPGHIGAGSLVPRMCPSAATYNARLASRLPPGAADAGCLARRPGRRDAVQERERGLGAQPLGLSPAAASTAAAVSMPTPVGRRLRGTGAH